MNNEYNIGLVQWWDEEEMEFYQADLTFSLNTEELCQVDSFRFSSLKYHIRFKLYDENGTYIGSTRNNTDVIRFIVAEEACGGYFCDLDEYRIICTEHQIEIINSFIAKS